MGKSIKLTRTYKKETENIETTIYVMVDNILYFEECVASDNTKGTSIFFNSVVGQSYAPLIVNESPDDIANLINSN